MIFWWNERSTVQLKHGEIKELKWKGLANILLQLSGLILEVKKRKEIAYQQLNYLSVKKKFHSLKFRILFFRSLYYVLWLYNVVPILILSYLLSTYKLLFSLLFFHHHHHHHYHHHHHHHHHHHQIHSISNCCNQKVNCFFHKQNQPFVCQQKKLISSLRNINNSQLYSRYFFFVILLYILSIFSTFFHKFIIYLTLYIGLFQKKIVPKGGYMVQYIHQYTFFLSSFQCPFLQYLYFLTHVTQSFVTLFFFIYQNKNINLKKYTTPSYMITQSSDWQ